jgi:hypothetical protein
MDKPWLINDKWPRTLRSNAKKSMIAAWSFAGFWNLVSWPAVFVLPEELGRVNWAALLVTLFPAIGLLLVFWAVKVTREWLKYGITELTLDPYPGSIGGHVGGTIVIQGADASVPFEVTAECVRTSVKIQGGKSRRESEVLWQTSGIAESVALGGGAEVRFRFDVPSGLPASDDDDELSHTWLIKLESRQADVALRRAFEIGVFPTAEHAGAIGVDTSKRAEDRAERTLRGAFFDPRHRAQLLEEHGLEVDQRDGWLRLYLRRGRQRGMAFMTFLIGLVFTGVMLFMPDEGFTTSVIRFAFGCFGVCLLLLSAYLPFNSLDVRISRRKLKRVRSWLGMVISSQEISPVELEELEIDKGSSTTSGTRTTIYYELVGRGDFGRFKLIESIPDRSLVEAIRRQVMLTAGLRLSPTH